MVPVHRRRVPKPHEGTHHWEIPISSQNLGKKSGGKQPEVTLDVNGSAEEQESSVKIIIISIRPVTISPTRSRCPLTPGRSHLQRYYYKDYNYSNNYNCNITCYEHRYNPRYKERSRSTPIGLVHKEIAPKAQECFGRRSQLISNKNTINTKSTTFERSRSLTRDLWMVTSGARHHSGRNTAALQIMPSAMDNLTTEEQRQVVDLVQDFFRYQLQKRNVRWTPPAPPAAADHLELCIALRSLGDEFLAKYRENVVQMVSRFELSNTHVESAFAAVLDEMFAEGVSWSRVVVSFVFSVEFAYQLVEKRLGEQCIEQTAQWLMNYTALRVVPWVRTHSGWVSVLCNNNNNNCMVNGGIV